MDDIDLWELCNGNGNCSRMFPWYLEPTKKDAFNRSWLTTYDRACEHIKKLKLRHILFLNFWGGFLILEANNQNQLK